MNNTQHQLCLYHLARVPKITPQTCVPTCFPSLQLTEFIIATIPTYMAVDESARLLKALQKDNIPCKRIVVNQVMRVEPLFVQFGVALVLPLCKRIVVDQVMHVFSLS